MAANPTADLVKSTRGKYLFSTCDLNSTLAVYRKIIDQRVESIPKSQLLSYPIDALAEHVASIIEIEPLEIYEEKKVVSRQRIDIGVDVLPAGGGRLDGSAGGIKGTRVTISIPFTGYPHLWMLRPSQYINNPPKARIRKGSGEAHGFIDIVLDQPFDEGVENLKYQLNRIISAIKFYVNYQRSEIDQFNVHLSERVKAALRDRSRKLQQPGTARAEEPEEKSGRATHDYKPIIMSEKIPRPIRPYRDRVTDHSDQTLSDRDYEMVLNILRNTGRNFERTREALVRYDEEILRDIMASSLNNVFKRQASSEVFRRVGKTDIQIEEEGRPAFVAGCKVWRGPNELLRSVDQLSEYLNLRVCKTALVFFNTNYAGASRLLDEIPFAFSGHSSFRKQLTVGGQGEWRFLINSPFDEHMEAVVHIFLFNMPAG